MAYPNEDRDIYVQGQVEQGTEETARGLPRGAPLRTTDDDGPGDPRACMKSSGRKRASGPSVWRSRISLRERIYSKANKAGNPPVCRKMIGSFEPNCPFSTKSSIPAKALLV